MNDINFKKIAKQIIKENPNGTLKEQAQELYNSALASPSLYKCRELIKEAQIKK